MFPETAAQVVATENFVWLHCVEHNTELKFNFQDSHTACLVRLVSKCDTGSISEDSCASEVQKS